MATDKKPRFTIVTTTINVPYLLRDYAEDAKRHHRAVDFIVVGDNKTPPRTSELCRALEDEFSLACLYLSPGEQRAYLAERAEFAQFLPWNCIQRRNVGLIKAYENGGDIVITIDDDNLLAHADYLGGHAHLGETLEVASIRSQTGWWNVCEMLEEANGVPFYHRGHPMSQRWRAEEAYSAIARVTARVVVNAGLWLDDPDVDAVTRLGYRVRAVGPGKKYRDRLACDLGTWAPFNSQNTALAREVIPAYFLFPHVGRYDDIWASYVVRHIADAFADLVSYGRPLVRQKRNVHNIYRDLDAERMGMEYTDAFIAALRACEVIGGTYAAAFKGLAEQFPEAISRACAEHELDGAPMNVVSTGLRLWSEMFDDGNGA